MVIQTFIRGTHTGGIDVAGPGSAVKAGKVAVAHPCSISSIDFPAGRCGESEIEVVVGMTSEQSINVERSCPSSESFSMEALNSDCNLLWLSDGR